MASKIDMVAGGRYKGGDIQAQRNFNDIQRNWRPILDEIHAPNGVHVGGAVQVRIVSNCTGGGKYNGMLVREPTTLACNSSNLTMPEGMSDDIACIVANQSENGMATHDLSAGSYHNGVFRGFVAGVPVVFVGGSSGASGCDKSGTTTLDGADDGSCADGGANDTWAIADNQDVAFGFFDRFCYDPVGLQFLGYYREAEADGCGKLRSIGAEGEKVLIQFGGCGEELANFARHHGV